MNGTTNTKPFAGFAPGEHRQLLADVNRWRRIQGWNWGDTRGLVNARFTSEATIAIDWAPADDKPQGFSIAVRDSVGRRWSSPDFYPAASLRQAVDLLVVLGVLPVKFSSLADTMRRLADEMETEAAVHDAPAGSMFLDAGFRIRQTLDGEYEPAGDAR